jgi:TPR repeat protein
MYANGRGVPRDERMAAFWRQNANESANNVPNGESTP